MELTQVLLSPVVTEKSNAAQAGKVYTFMVHLDASKVDVAKVVSKMYGVAVKSVNMIPVRKKVRVAGKGKTITKRHTSKKALVTIESKQILDVNKFSKK